MAYETDGFLSPDLDGLRASVMRNHRRLHELARRLNQFAVRKQYELEIHRDSPRQVLVAALFARTLQNAQAAILLLELGMRSQAEAMVRVAMESLFTFGAIAKDDQYHLAYVRADAESRRKLSEKVKQWDPSLLNAMTTRTDVERLRQMAIDDLANQHGGSASAYEAAKSADLLGWYLSAYSILSGPIHTSVRDLEEAHICFDASGEVSAIRAEPTTNGMTAPFVATTEILMQLLRVAENFLSLQISEFLDQQHRELGEIMTELQSHS